MIQVLTSFLSWPLSRTYAFFLKLILYLSPYPVHQGISENFLYCYLFLTCCSCGYMFFSCFQCKFSAPCTELLASHFCFLFIFKMKLPFTLLRWYYWLARNIRYFRLFSGSDDGFILSTCIFPPWFPGNYGHSFKWEFFMAGVAV